jgi:chitinase
VSETNPRKIVIGYYEGWNINKPCGTMQPEEIPVHMLTHIFFSFAFIAPDTYKLENMKDFPPSMFGRVTNLKTKNPDLKVLIAIGVRCVKSLFSPRLTKDTGLDTQ